MIYKCDVCGKFVSLNSAGAVRRLLTPDSQFTTETYETLCKQHATSGEAKAASLAGEKGNG